MYCCSLQKAWLIKGINHSNLITEKKNVTELKCKPIKGKNTKVLPVVIKLGKSIRIK